jgi:uncharacterized cupredoxin-like copper-binding protein/Cu/Ag efflux protein CusF
MKTLKLIAALAILACSSAVFAHNSSHAAKTQAAPEQKDWGIAGTAKAVTRTVTVTMLDAMRFSPDVLDVKVGETIKLVVQNKGKVLHELVIGTKAELDAHAALMVKFPDMAHDEPYMAHVAPQKTSQLIWTFNRAGEFDFACLINGHYQSGMVGKIRVAAVGEAPAMAVAIPTESAQSPEMTEAEVRKVDMAAGKVTLRHGEIKNLDMPPMTMVFQVKDRAFLSGLKAGDRVNFTADKVKGAYTVLTIEVIQ